MQIELQGQIIELLPQKAFFFKEHGTLLISDLHLGKASHFRKSGIPVPNAVYDQNIENLVTLLQWKKPKVVFFLGDLFHSVYNREWRNFQNVIEQFPQIDFRLVLGNHDILDRKHYSSCGIQVIEESCEYHGFLLSHEPLEHSTSLYNLYGHLHPGVLLSGRGKQALRLPCFHFMKQSGVLPAFGTFTGLAIQKPKQGELVYVVAENEVICVS